MTKRKRDAVPQQVNLYDCIAAEIERCAGSDAQAALAQPLFHAPSSDQHNAIWQPKACLTSVLAEEVSGDDLIEVELVRFLRARGLYVKFKLKRSDNGPVRCVVVLNGTHAIRIAIARGMVGSQRTYAEALLNLDSVTLGGPRGLDVEVLRGSSLLYYARLVPRRQSLREWIMFSFVMGTILHRQPFFSKLRMQPVYVSAIRLLEDSVRIGAK